MFHWWGYCSTPSLKWTLWRFLHGVHVDFIPHVVSSKRGYDFSKEDFYRSRRGCQ
ncbi:hypothetical protein SCHPADRAFT_909124 [Schizopora paradoxa]|uniref:Uncharacterized protein n=1 Tax=Schizopora paradoxa TaxID=27342 RepID=A0A0H2R7G2_9AGAM|nr:hypothetical protein SCHPADRAFT_909328 [Schizopora paradoxa]KLO07804.1 hypothetical protein SCHPADRAFT_909124 [Schizopora paradoxa]